MSEVNRKSGYGYFSWKNYPITAHRMSVILDGRDPTGMEVDHVCRHRTCVRPDHLEIVTGLENRRRQIAKMPLNANGNKFLSHEVASRW